MNVNALRAIVAAVRAGVPPPELFYGEFTPSRTYPAGAIVERNGALWLLIDGEWVPQTGPRWDDDVAAYWNDQTDEFVAVMETATRRLREELEMGP